MTHAEYTTLRKALESVVELFAEKTGIPVEAVWECVSDISMDKWEVT